MADPHVRPAVRLPAGVPADSGFAGATPSAVLAVLAVGVLLRISLALVNTDANDPHLPVIATIAFEHRFPERQEHWEAFQPKLYHTTVALLWRLAPPDAPVVLNRIAQIVSCAAGIGVLLVMLQFLRQLPTDPRTRLFVFALVALNPQLIGMSGQATNDMFVVLFASLALYSGYLFFRDGARAAFAGLVLGATLAGLSKGNGLVVIIAVVLTFAVALVGHAPGNRLTRRRTAGYGLVFLVVVIPAVWKIAPYEYHFRTYGSPFVTNWEPPPRPHLWRQTYVERPGVTSLAHGLLTFRLIDLLRNPVSTWMRTEYPQHRTSVWTRAYAQLHVVHFEAYPHSWRPRTPGTLHLGRALLILALFPTLLFAWKLAAVGVHAIRWLVTRGADGMRPEQVLLVLAAVGYLGFVAAYAVHLRDYSSIKAIFALPGLLGFGLLLAMAFDGFHARIRCRPITRRAAELAIIALLIGYAADVGILIRSLALFPD